MWDPDINYLALIPIVVYAYLLPSIRYMHALSSRMEINMLTPYTHSSMHGLNGAYAQELTRNTPTQRYAQQTALRRTPP
jgi:hypothetical protein